MADKLIIVESPAKANTIKKFLGGNIKVMASCHKFISVPERFYVYFMNEESVMHTKIWGFNYIRDFNDEIDKHILAL